MQIMDLWAFNEPEEKGLNIIVHQIRNKTFGERVKNSPIAYLNMQIVKLANF